MVITCTQKFIYRVGLIPLRFKKGEKFKIFYEDTNEDKLGYDYIVKNGFKLYICHINKEFMAHFEEDGEGLDVESLRDSFRNL